MDETVEKIIQQYYWSNMKKIVQNSIKDCEMSAIYGRNLVKTKINVSPIATRHLENTHFDTFIYILDNFSQFFEIRFSLHSLQYTINR